MDDVITRLRASKQRADDEYYRKGNEYGREWAKNDAEADELTQLERWKASIGWEWDRCFDENPTSGYGMDELMVFEIWPDEGRDRQAADDFWERVLGDANDPSRRFPMFVKGFIEAAVSVSQEVKDQL